MSVLRRDPPDQPEIGPDLQPATPLRPLTIASARRCNLRLMTLTRPPRNRSAPVPRRRRAVPYRNAASVSVQTSTRLRTVGAEPPKTVPHRQQPHGRYIIGATLEHHQPHDQRRHTGIGALPCLLSRLMQGPLKHVWGREPAGFHQAVKHVIMILLPLPGPPLTYVLLH
jgi:hypothetical protein